MRTTTVSRWILAACCAPLLGALAAPVQAYAALTVTSRISPSQNLDAHGGDSWLPAVSADGRFVVYASLAFTAPKDTNGTWDVFCRDRLKGGEPVLLSMNSAGSASGNAASGITAPSISADGRFVVFDSDASDLVAGDTNGTGDVFLYDVAAKKTTRLSLGVDGAEANGRSDAPRISGDGRFVVFTSTATNLVTAAVRGLGDVFRRDIDTGVTELVSIGSGGVVGDRPSSQPSISDDGRVVAFSSDASNLVPGDTDRVGDVFVRDFAGSADTTLVSVGLSGTPADAESAFPAVSGDGAHVAFGSLATNLVTGDTNDAMDVFVRDLGAGGATSRVSVSTGGVQGASDSQAPSISFDGRYVAFESLADGLVSADGNASSDVFLRDRTAGTTVLVSASTAGAKGNAASLAPAISSSGACVAFASDSTNLVAADSNHLTDVFVRANARLPLVGTPIAPAAMSRTKSSTILGYLSPRHTKGTHPVRIYRWLLVGGTWKSYGYVSAIASNYSTYTKYSASVRLPYAGSWRVRALAPKHTGHDSVWSSGYDYVTVK